MTFIRFLVRLVRRGFTLTYLPAFAHSKGAKFLWHSPLTTFFRSWWVIIGSLVLIGLSLGLPLTRFEQARTELLAKPESKQTHLDLAKSAAATGDYALAEKELRAYQEAVDTKVLGTTSETDQTRLAVFPQLALEEEAERWHSVLETKPNYRDGLLRLAILSWQLNNLDAALMFWEEAQALDPNNPFVREVETLLR